MLFRLAIRLNKHKLGGNLPLCLYKGFIIVRSSEQKLTETASRRKNRGPRARFKTITKALSFVPETISLMARVIFEFTKQESILKR